MNKLILGDCIESLKKVPTASIDLICTDPPYGIGFKGHVWDKAVPSVETWRACLRVLKPGGFAFIMSAPRQDVLSQMIARLGQAGFVTDFTPIYWTFPSGLPKAANISKMADRRVGARRKVVATTSRIVKRGLFFGTYGAAPVRRVREKITDAESPQAKALDGAYAGFQPKPAVEVVIVAMKPLSQKTFLDQALSNGKGITWLDDCRIPVHATTCPSQSQLAAAKGKDRLRGGRFPANLLVSSSVLNNARSATKHGPTHIASVGGVSVNVGGVPEQWNVDPAVSAAGHCVHRHDADRLSRLPRFGPRDRAVLHLLNDPIGHALVQSGDAHVLLLGTGIREFGCRGARGRTRAGQLKRLYNGAAGVRRNERIPWRNVACRR
jgi:hypothetical protein